MTVTQAPNTLLLSKLYTPGENALVSPLSIQIALAMLAMGASGETRAELDAMTGSMASLDGVATDEVVRIANSLWAASSIKTSYQSQVGEAFGAETHTLGDPAAAVKRINAWVAGATDEQITELLPEGSIDQLTRLVLINAILFKGTWVQAFDPEHTREQPFHAPGGTKTVPMMRRAAPMLVEVVDGYAAVKLDYESGYSLHAILPAEGVDPLEAMRQHRGDAYRREKVELALPRFDLRCKASLQEALTALGCSRMFESNGELDGLSDDPLLYVSKVLHEACMRTDEQGTVAAAATAVMVRMRSAGPRTTRYVTFDRPFGIKLMAAERALFVGVVSDPSAA
jgi:serpin B